MSYCSPRRRRRFRGCADGVRGVHVRTQRPARTTQPCGFSRTHPGYPPLPPTPSDERAPYCQPAAGGPKSETALGFVNGMLGKCVRLTVFHMCFSEFSPGRHVCVAFFERSAGKVRVLLRVRGEERERTVSRAADSLPGSYFIVLLPLTHPESCLYGNECKSERRDKLRSGLCA